MLVRHLSLLALVALTTPIAALAQVDPGQLTGIVVDDADAEFVGEWKKSTHTRGYTGVGYQHDDKTGKGEKSATYRMPVETEGTYQLLVSYTPGNGRDKQVPVTIHAAGGPVTVKLNEEARPQLGTGYQPLGEFSLEAGVIDVVIETKGTTGHVIVDAVRLLTPDEFAEAVKKEKSAPKVVAKKDDKPAPPPPKRPDFTRPSVERAVAELTAAQLDAMLHESLGNVKEAPVVDDAWFLRRVTLDLVGRQPSLEELQAFLDDESDDKRANAVDRLLGSPEYGENWANYWSDTIAMRTPEPQLTFLDYTAYKAWLAEQLNEDVGWDEIAFRMMTPVGKVKDDPAGSFIGFHQGEPNRIAGETTRVFLSVKIACAQCHDHPFVDMPQEVFHGMAAFFVRAKVKVAQNDSLQIDIGSDPKKEHRMPGSKEDMKPTVLGGDTHDLGLSDIERRTRLGYWLVDGDNGHFARSYVNRMWSRLMGRGFYDPVDDMGAGTEAELAEIQDALADHFIATGFDTKAVFRAIVLTRAYQRPLLSDAATTAETEKQPFATAATKLLRGDEVFDSLEAAIELPNVKPPIGKKTAAVRFPIPPKSTRDLVNEAFGYDPSFPDSWISRTMDQAMFLMNNAQVQAQVNAAPDSGTILAKLVAEESDDAKVVDTLFRRVLAREPSSGEREIVLAHIAAVDDRGQAFEDVLWSLLNTAEFTTRK